MKWFSKLSKTCIFLLTINQGIAQETVPANDTDGFLEIQGIVVVKDFRLEGVTVRLFKGNSKVDSVYTGKNGGFQFDLGKDCYYAMEFSRVGFENTCVVINTYRNVPKPKKERGYLVEFEVELIPEVTNKSELSSEDIDALDFPKVMIVYTAGKDEGFYSDKKYLKSVKESLKKIKPNPKENTF